MMTCIDVFGSWMLDIVLDMVKRGVGIRFDESW